MDGREHGIGATKGERFYIDDPRMRGARIVIRAWPVQRSPWKWIIEAYADLDCPVELAVLPVSSAFGSAEADELTKLLLSERGARVFSQGQRVFNGVMEFEGLYEALDRAISQTSVMELSTTLKGICNRREQEARERVAKWKKQMDDLSKELSQ